MPISNQKLIRAGNHFELSTNSRPTRYGYKRDTRRHRRNKKSGVVTLRSIWKTKRSVRLLLLANAYQYEKYKPIFITFTFKDDVIDLKIAQKQFSKFIKRLNYKIFKTKYNNLKYLGVPEIQNKREIKYGVGVWHFHIIFFNLPYLENIYDEIYNIWGLGFTLVQTINDVNHLILYLSKYLTKDNMDSRLFGKKKYFPSRGLKKPMEFREPSAIKAIMNSIQDKKLVFEKTFKSIERMQETLYQVYTTNNISDLNNTK
jgi:hypothetical protein